MKNKKFPLANIIIIAAVVGITILTILEYFSIMKISLKHLFLITKLNY